MYSCCPSVSQVFGCEIKNLTHFWVKRVVFRYLLCPPPSFYSIRRFAEPLHVLFPLALSFVSSKKNYTTSSIDSLEYFFSVPFPRLTRKTTAPFIMLSTRTFVALAMAFSPLALAATLISDATMTNYLNAGGRDLAFANSPFVTPALPHRLALLRGKLADDGSCPLVSGFLVKL